MPECEHGDPHPARCALCRVREHPARYPARAPRGGGVPRPVYYQALVEHARESRSDTP
jgi:hypothetical protein